MPPKKAPAANAVDFDAMSPAELDALDGHRREAWYAHRRGQTERARAILAAYGDTSPAPAPVEKR